MASSDGSDSRTNSLTNRSSSTVHNDEELQTNELKGWLMKRTKISRKWKKQWSLLQNTHLQYGNTPEVTRKRDKYMK
jgi:EH domain-containing protein 1